MPEQQRFRAPGTVRLAAVLVAGEGAALLALAVVELAQLLVSDGTSLGLVLGTAGMAVAGGGLLLCLAGAVLRLRPAARSPVVVVQLIALPVGYNLAGASGRPEVGLPVIALAAAVLALLFTPGARAALDRTRGP